MLEDLKSQAQEVLDELYREKLLPFKLIAHRVDGIGLEEYIVRFHDSRLSTVDVSWQEEQSFKDVFRAAFLERMKRLKALSKNATQ